MNTVRPHRPHTPTLAALLVASSLLAAVPAAHAEGRRVVRPNAAGGTTATRLAGRQGPEGGRFGAARGVATDGQGNVVAGSASRLHGPAGGLAQRAGRTQVHADGSAQHQGTLSASNARGSLQSTGNATCSADGTVEASRSSSATQATTGNSVQRSTQYSSSTGLTHSATCFDASGATIACR
ncbi:MAG: hypothetical protein KBC94_09520 [Pseudacidovorax sp.]|uniref:hypothetical protein n=1 Tax=Pseudacidovorax sp. TaxID=1934311 RepID=UPI001B4388DE|nr:hypothetical protein [Pseudacidovorax sp.]MBP6894649.1 hypothetical protein [Pseudacidovorax sp.]